MNVASLMSSSTNEESQSEFTICQPWQLPNNCSILLNCNNIYSSTLHQDDTTTTAHQEEDIMESIKSDRPTRHIALYSNQLLAVGHEELFKELKTSGEIRTTYPLLAVGITIFSYYKLNDAQTFLQIINKNFVSSYKACYVNPCIIDQKLNEKMFVTITFRDNMKKFDYMEHLLKFGTVYSLSEADITNQFKVINIEYDDERSSERLLNELNNVPISGAKFQVYKGVNDQFMCTCPDNYFSNDKYTFTDHHYYTNNDKTAQPAIHRKPSLPISPWDDMSSFYSNNYNNHSFFSSDPFNSAVVHKEEEEQQHSDDDVESSSSSKGSKSSSMHSWKDLKRESIDSQASLISSASNSSVVRELKIKTHPLEDVSIIVDSNSTNSSQQDGSSTPTSATTSIQNTLSPSSSHANTTPIASLAGHQKGNKNHGANKELDIEKIMSGEDTRTSFMIRNIPNKYTQQMLIESIDKTHANTYDFLYLRFDFKNKCNVGYGFINFIDVKSVISFAKDRVGKKWKLFNSEKKCSLNYADIQGKEALVRKFKNSQVMVEDESFRPKIFYSSGPNKGKEQPFPVSVEQQTAVTDSTKGNEKSSYKYYNHHRSSNRSHRKRNNN